MTAVMDAGSFWATYKWHIIIVVSSIIIAYSSVYFLGKNNPIELEVENFIEQETGYHIDLTP